MPNINDLQATLLWLAGAGAGTWMLYISNLVRNLRTQPLPADAPLKRVQSWLNSLDPLTLQALLAALSVGVPIGAGLLLSALPAEAFAQLQGWWGWLAPILFAYIAQQGYYQMVKG